MDSEERFETMLTELGTPRVDLAQLPRGPDVMSIWRTLKRLKKKGLVRTLGVRDLSPDELKTYGIINEVEYAQCKFSPYKPGPTRHTWQEFGKHSIALTASALISDWPRALSPTEDPHLLAVASRVKRSVPQILIRWALQLGLAVVFQSEKSEHISENLLALGFVLPESEMRLISGLATLAQPYLPPGDGYAHIYTGRSPKQKLTEL